MNKNLSNRIYCIKAMFILCTIYAHVIFNSEVYAGGARLIGTLGVPGFFVLSGYFFNYDKSFTEFWRTKIKMTIIPWVIWSEITYIFSAFIAGKSVDIFEAVKWTMGIGTWLYYIPVFLILEIIFYKANNNISCLISIAINIISILIYRYNILLDISWSMYINIFNWCGFFCLGILIRRYNMLENILEFTNKNILIITGVLFIVSLIQYKANILSNYVSELNILIEITGCLFIFALSKYIIVKPIINIGRHTFIIYLIHMQIVGFILARIQLNRWFEVFKPIIGLVIVYIFVCVLSWVIDRFKVQGIKPFLGLK